MELKDRLKQTRLSKVPKPSQEDVARAVGMSQPGYQKLESGQNVKSAYIPLIAEFLNVDPFWLVTGVHQDSLSESEPGQPNLYKSLWLDIVETYFSCSLDRSINFHFQPVGKYPFPPLLLSEKNLDKDLVRLIISKDQSMADYIRKGDLVAINLAQKQIIDGHIYAFYLANELMVKQIFKEADGSLLLHNFSEKYKDKVISSEDLHNFKVMGEQFWRSG